MKDNIIDPIPVRDQVAAIVRRQIITGELAPNQQLSERALGETLGVSTTPVKEAFRMLETEGLVVTVPRKGTFVSEIFRENLVQITFIRAALEGTAALFATNAATADEFETMRRELDEAHRCIEKQDKDGLMSHNSCFHDTIRKAARNPYLFNLLRTLRAIDESVRTVSLDKSDEERLEDHRDHTNIFEAMLAKDGDKAEALMNHHVRRVITDTLEGKYSI